MNSEHPDLLSSFSDELLLKALQTSNDATAIYINEDLLIRFANKAMLEIWGKDATVVGKTFEEAIPEIQGQPFTEILQKVWRSGITYSAVDTPADLIVDGKLQTFYFDFEYRAIQNESGKTWALIHTARDVTQRHTHMLRLAQMDEGEQVLNEELAATVEELTSTNEDLNSSMILLADSREHIKTLIEQAPIGICMLQGPELIIEIANPVILNIWGRKEHEVIGKPHHEARKELTGQPVYQWLDDVFKSGIPKVNQEFRVLLKDGKELREAYVNSIYQPVKSSRGEITGVLVILEEITDQLLSRREHEKAQEMLTLAIDAGELGTFYYEPHNNLFSGNELLKTWFGLSADEKIDLSHAIASIVEEDRERVTKAIADALNHYPDGRYAIEYQIRSSVESVPRTVQAIGKVRFDVNGNAISLNGTLRDITEQKKDEQRKDDFISMVSHELKTPLTSLNAYIQLLQRQAIKSNDLHLSGILEKALKQIKTMTSMINGFLNVSRLDSGKMSIDRSDFDLKEMLTEVEADLQSTIHTHQLVFEGSESLKLFADREKISQVIQNLVGNAVKYSPMGSAITVSYQKANENKVLISVTDRGMGISSDDQQHIFERYYRVKNKDTGSIAGFGIGLYLCKEIIERHHGNISLDSKLGKGSVFVFSLPISTF